MSAETLDRLLRLRSLTAEQRARYSQLLAREPRRDYLDAVDSVRRTLTLELDSDRLLRIPATASQKRAMGRLREELRTRIREQMGRRRPFRGPVSVEIDLHATAMTQPPASPPSVKAYLDLLGKRGEPALVYTDDHQVRHLRVRRHAGDHPIHRAEPEDWLHMDYPRFPWGPPAGVQVGIVVRPLRVYIADYDRLFRRRVEVFGVDWDPWGLTRDDRPGARFWAPGWDALRDHDRLDELREEDLADAHDQGLYRPDGFFGSPEMRELREGERRRRKREHKALLDRLLLAQSPGELDRPGPVAEVDRLSWTAIPQLVAVERLPPITGGVFYLPLPTGSSWVDAVHTEMEAHRSKVRLLERPLDTPLSLDIAVRGAGKERRDYDNMAHDLLAPFEEIFCAGRRGTVVSYRVYESEGDPGVRVMAMTDQRLNDMEDAITTSRDWVLRHGPRLMRERY